MRGLNFKLCILAAVLLPACEREERRFREVPAAAARVDGPVRMTDLQPGPAGPAGGDRTVQGPYDGNAYGISEGKRLYQWYNCSGCHSNGGGGIGPALIDDRWIYGSDPENIFATIVEGRPNGMPSYGGKLPEQQVWQIVAYVRSMGRFVPKAAASGRSDHMAARPSEQSLKRGEPRGDKVEHLP
jgi:cytochrome c oxidase cbb3-type subunit 3